MPRYLVTGAAGFIGSHILEALHTRGEDVAGMDDFSTGYRRNLEGIDAPFTEGDINDGDLMESLLKGTEIVFHEAAIPSVPRSVKDPMGTHRANVDGTLSVLLAAAEAGVRRVVYASSSSIYGDQPTLPKVETQTPAPLSPYAVQKWVGEVYCRVIGKTKGMETVALRYFNVFGPRQDPDSPYAAVIPIFIRSLMEGKRPTIYGDGEQTRDFTFVKDVVEANLRAADAFGIDGEVINVAAGGTSTINDLFTTIREILGGDLEPIHADPRPGDVRHSRADVTLLKNRVRHVPTRSLEMGLEETIRWYRSRAG
jgi:nucleoside-diphosphate-sugar epimerase